MVAVQRDIVIEQGVTFEDVLTWKTGSPAVPVDISDYTAKMQIRPVIGSPTVLVEIIPTLGGVAGIITCALTAEQTAALSFPGTREGSISYGTDTCGRPIQVKGQLAVYDLELYNGPAVVRLTQGTVCLSKEVTR